MHIEDIREYCLCKPHVIECFPFDEDTLAFKVAGKMFLFASLEKNSINLKCDPEKALFLREHYPSVTPGYHMSKKHWNSVALNGDISSALIQEWIDDSYNEVIIKLPKKIQEALK